MYNLVMFLNVSNCCDPVGCLHQFSVNALLLPLLLCCYLVDSRIAAADVLLPVYVLLSFPLEPRKVEIVVPNRLRSSPAQV